MCRFLVTRTTAANPKSASMLTIRRSMQMLAVVIVYRPLGITELHVSMEGRSFRKPMKWKIVTGS